MRTYYKIAMLRNMYDPDLAGKGAPEILPEIYDTIDDAQDAVEDLENTSYCCVNGEAGAPQYCILSDIDADYIGGSNYDREYCINNNLMNTKTPEAIFDEKTTVIDFVKSTCDLLTECRITKKEGNYYIWQETKGLRCKLDCKIFDDLFIEEIKKLTHDNQHDIACLVIAKFVDARNALKIIQHINAIHCLEGFLPEPLFTYRNKVMESVFSFIESKFDAEIANKIKGAL